MGTFALPNLTYMDLKTMKRGDLDSKRALGDDINEYRIHKCVMYSLTDQLIIYSDKITTN